MAEFDQRINMLFEKWESIFYKHQNDENVEVEIRFGKTNRGSFDTNIGKDTFEKVLRRLQRYQGWESVKETNSTVYYDESANKRVTMDDASEEMTCVVKKRVCIDNQPFENLPFDVRLSVSTEVPYERIEDDPDENFTRVRKKHRYSFVRKNLTIDVSEVSGDAEDKDDDTDTMYQLELEIIDPKKVENRAQLYNIINKVSDLSKIIVV